MSVEDEDDDSMLGAAMMQNLGGKLIAKTTHPLAGLTPLGEGGWDSVRKSMRGCRDQLQSGNRLLVTVTECVEEEFSDSRGDRKPSLTMGNARRLPGPAPNVPALTGVSKPPAAAAAAAAPKEPPSEAPKAAAVADDDSQVELRKVRVERDELTRKCEALRADVSKLTSEGRASARVREELRDLQQAALGAMTTECDLQQAALRDMTAERNALALQQAGSEAEMRALYESMTAENDALAQHQTASAAEARRAMTALRDAQALQQVASEAETRALKEELCTERLRGQAAQATTERL